MQNPLQFEFSVHLIDPSKPYFVNNNYNFKTHDLNVLGVDKNDYHMIPIKNIQKPNDFEYRKHFFIISNY